MGPAEMGARATREARKLVERALQTAGLCSAPYQVDFQAATSASGGAGRGSFFFDQDDELLRSQLSQLNAAYDEEARGALAHRVQILGQEYELGDSIDWHRDYRLGRRCPVRYSSFIDLKDPELEESVRWVWYLNRHRHLAALGRAYFVSREREYAQEIVDQMLAWIEQNPPAVGVNWAAPLELALRLLSWSWALFPIRDFDGFSGKAQKRIVSSVGLQLMYVSRNLSTYSAANNHLIAQAASLFVVGGLFPGLRGSRSWRERGAEILWREILRQTYPDGVSKEQSVHYHAFVAELCAVSLLFAKRNAVEVPASVKERFGQMCDFLTAVCGAGKRPPAIGDSDDQSVLLPVAPRPLMEGLTACAAYVLDREDLASAVGELPLEAALLLGREGMNRLTSIAARASERPRVAPRSRSRAFPEGGYYVLSDGAPGLDVSCLVDCGDLGLGKTAAHGHADCLSLTLRANGKDVLIDPGTFTYHSQPRWRSYFRSTAAHNTISVDGQSQSQMLGPFVWGKRARGRVKDVTLENYFDFVTGWHDGYSRLKDPVKHQRAVVLVKPGLLVIVDVLTGKKWHEYEQNFHFGGRAAMIPEQGCAAVSEEDAGVETLLFSPALGSGGAALVEGRTEPILGWNSPVFWEKTPSRCLTISGRFKGAVLLEACVVLVPHGERRPEISFAARGREGRLYSVMKRKAERFEETLLVNLTDDEAGDESLRSDASYACLREFSAGGFEILGRNVGKMTRGGQVVFESTSRLAFMRMRIDKQEIRYEARGEGVVSVRSEGVQNVISSMPGIKWERSGEFVKIHADS